MPRVVGCPGSWGQHTFNLVLSFVLPSFSITVTRVFHQALPHIIVGFHEKACSYLWCVSGLLLLPVGFLPDSLPSTLKAGLGGGGVLRCLPPGAEGVLDFCSCQASRQRSLWCDRPLCRVPRHQHCREQQPRCWGTERWGKDMWRRGDPWPLTLLPRQLSKFTLQKWLSLPTPSLLCPGQSQFSESDPQLRL